MSERRRYAYFEIEYLRPAIKWFQEKAIALLGMLGLLRDDQKD